MAGMKVSPGFEDPSARPDTKMAARLLMALTALVTFAAFAAVAVWLWPAVADLASRLWSTLIGLMGVIGSFDPSA